MDDRPDMRASDAERQDVVERLRAALDDGQLKRTSTSSGWAVRTRR